MERYTSKYWVTFISKTLGKKIVIYSQLEHHHTNPNESKCIRYKRIGPRLCEHRRTGNFLLGGALNHLPKKISQVAQIFTKESERKEGRITTT